MGRRESVTGACVAVAATALAIAAARGAAPPDAAIAYRDIAPDSKLGYITNNHYTGRKYFPQPMTGGIAVLDYDRDGRLDLFLSNGARFPEIRKTDPSFDNCLLRNAGGGKFENVTGKAGVAGRDLGFSLGVAAGDYDNDGDPDLFVANIGPNALYRNNGDGTFTDVSPRSGLRTKDADVISIGGAWFDYDNDGRLDLVVADYTHWTPAGDHICKSAGVEGYCSPRMYPGSPQRLYRNLGGDRFEDVTAKSGFGEHAGKGMGIATFDANGDGRIDVFIANDTTRNLLFINNGDGTFRESALALGAAYNDDGTSVSGMGADARDFDNDGHIDIFYNDLMTQIFGLFRNLGNGAFEYISAPYRIAQLSREVSGWSPGFIDYDNDGWKDLFSANGDIDNTAPNSRQHDTMWRNMDGKRFADVSAQMGPDFLRLGYQRASAFLDWNDDGFLDIAVTSLNDTPRFLMSSGGNRNQWLLVELTGTRSNRDAIGAKLRAALPSGRVLHNHVAPSIGFMSSSDKRVHFGLGRETTVRELEVRWPSGLVQRVTGVKAGQVLRLTEPR